ncbi:MAG: alpha/beta hydrolase [Hyphomicrobiales bacterium]
MTTPAHDFSALDRSEVLSVLFHPRQEPGTPGWNLPDAEVKVPGVKDLLVPVGDNIVVGARMHLSDRTHANILFFHGNGEIAADYDEIGPFYHRIGVNFLAADYRGYGRSTGHPTVASMMRDCHTIFRFVMDWLAQNGFTGPLVLMGRSLGSASAIELAATCPDRVCGLIVESGFAYAGPLLRLLGVNPAAIGFREEIAFDHLNKIRRFRGPLLVIHAEFDHIIPFSDGQALFEASPSADKALLKIPGANHNDILAHGFSDYLAAVHRLTASCLTRRAS